MTRLAFVSLLLVAIMVSTASAKGGIANCCRKLSKTQVHRDSLKSYYKQHKSACPIDAVVFTTLRNIKICSDPKNTWAMTSMAYIDGKTFYLTQTTSPTQ